MPQSATIRFLSIIVILSLVCPLPILGYGGTPNSASESPVCPELSVAGYDGMLYTGQLHNHAGEWGDDGAETVEYNMEYMKYSASPPFDFGGLAPHSHLLTDSNMLNYWSDMAPYTDAGFVAIPGQEWSSLSTSGHVNVYLGNNRCPAPNGDIPGFYNWLNTSGGYGSFNHPWDSSGSDMNNWQYYQFQDKPGNFAGKMVMMEMKQAAGDESAFDDYTEALGKGWHIGITVNDDTHAADPGDRFANHPRTGMWLDSLSESSVETALQELRFFGTQLVGGYIDLRAETYTMGDIFMGTNSTVLYAMLNPAFTYSSVDIYIDGANYPMAIVDAGHYSYTIQAGASHYYFVRAKETATGAYIISSPMWSGSGGSTPDPPPSVEAPTNVTAELSGTDVIVRWDESLDAGVSNATALILPTDDAQVAEGYPTTNYGSATGLYVQSDSASAYLDERTWMRYDIASAIPEGATITSASVKLYCWKATGSNMDAGCHPSSDDTWLESGINWNNQPSYGPVMDTKTLVVGMTNLWYAWDVTSFIQAEWAGDRLASLMIKAVTEGSNPTKTYAFESTEFATAGLRPNLEVSYSAISGSGHYEIHRGNFHDPLGTSYSYIGQVPAGAASYTDSGVGDGNPNNYFYTVRAVNAENNFTAALTQAGKFTTLLQAGWNLVSVPLLTNNATPASILQSVNWDRAVYFDTLDTADHWKTDRQSIPSSIPDLHNIHRHMGLWVYSASADTLITAGQVANFTAIELHPGWNLVGYPAMVQRPINEALAGTGFDRPVEGLDAASATLLQQYSGTYPLRPGEGYWVHVPADTIWTIDW